MRDARQVLLVGWTLWWCKKISATVDGQVDMSERPAATSNQAFAPAYSAPPSPSTSFTNLKVHTSLNREGSRVLSKRSRPTNARNETDDSTESKPENEEGQAAIRTGEPGDPTADTPGSSESHEVVCGQACSSEARRGTDQIGRAHV